MQTPPCYISTLEIDTHTSVNKWIPSLALAPHLKPAVVIAPADFLCVRFESVIHANSWEENENMTIKLL